MTMRDSLHHLADDLPETEIRRAKLLLAVLQETAEPLDRHAQGFVGSLFLVAIRPSRR